MSDVHQIVYLSRATRPLAERDAVSLCAVAREVNAGLGVTGLLLHDGQRFIQALEGSEAAVSDVMTRIARDPRHRAIAYIHRGPIAQRQFGTWSMNMYHVHDRASAETFVGHVKQAMGDVSDINLRAAFIGFAVMGRAERLRARAA